MQIFTSVLSYVLLCDKVYFVPAGPMTVIETYVRNYGMHNDSFRGLWDYLIIQFFLTSDLLNGQVIKQFWVKLKPTEANL